MLLRQLWLGTCTSSFASQEDEEAFRQSLEPDLLTSTVLACVACALFTALFTSSWLWNSDSCVRTLNIAHGATMISLSISLILAILASKRKAEQAIRWEIVTFVYVLLLISSANMDSRLEHALCNTVPGVFDVGLYLFQEMFLSMFIAFASSSYIPLRARWMGWILAYSVVLQVVKFGFAAHELRSGFSMYLVAYAGMHYFTLHGTVKNERARRARWQAVRRVAKQAETLTSQHEAACAILLRLCDCVLEVDRDMKILEAGQQFSAMLFLQGSSIDGKNFKEFCVQGHEPELIDSSGTCQVTNVRLRSVDGADFPATLYYVKFEVNGKHRFLMGLQEDLRSASQDAYQESLPRLPEAQSLAGQVTDADSDVSSDTSAMLDMEEAATTVSLEPGLPMRSHTRGFSQLVARAGSSSGVGECLGCEDELNEMGIEAASLARGLMDVAPVPVTTASSDGKRYRANARLYGIQLSATSGDILLEIRLRQVKRMRKNQRRKLEAAGRPGPLAIGSSSLSHEITV